MKTLFFSVLLCLAASTASAQLLYLDINANPVVPNGPVTLNRTELQEKIVDGHLQLIFRGNHILTLRHWEPSNTATFTTSSMPPEPDKPAWEIPRMAQLALQWEANPDADRYRIEYRSSRTTNIWTKADVIRAVKNPPGDIVNHTIVVDMSVPVWTQIIAIGENGSPSAPSDAVKHPPVTPPRPMGKHRQMYSQEIINSPEHRSRKAPTPIIPPPLPP